MALAFEGAGGVAATMGSGSGSITSFNVDCGTNGDRFIFVYIQYTTNFGHSISGVTVGGNAMTSLGAAFGSSVFKGQGWYYTGPSTGSQAVVASYTGGTGTRGVTVSAAAYSGVDQTTPYTGYSTLDNTTTDDVDITITSATGDFVLIGGGSGNGTWTADDAGATIRDQRATATSGSYSCFVSDRAGASSVATEHTNNGAWSFARGLGISLEAAAAAGGGTILPLINQMLMA